MKYSCETCDFWSLKGYCTRYPPVFANPTGDKFHSIENGLSHGDFSWPSTSPDDLCGEYKGIYKFDNEDIL